MLKRICSKLVLVALRWTCGSDRDRNIYFLFNCKMSKMHVVIYWAKQLLYKKTLFLKIMTELKF